MIEPIAPPWIARKLAVVLKDGDGGFGSSGSTIALVGEV
jgi:hypothetical protein